MGINGETGSVENCPLKGSWSHPADSGLWELEQYMQTLSPAKLFPVFGFP